MAMGLIKERELIKRLLSEMGMGSNKPSKDDKVPRDQQQWEAVTSLSLIGK